MQRGTTLESPRIDVYDPFFQRYVREMPTVGKRIEWELHEACGNRNTARQRHGDGDHLGTVRIVKNTVHCRKAWIFVGNREGFQIERLIERPRFDVRNLTWNEQFLNQGAEFCYRISASVCRLGQRNRGFVSEISDQGICAIFLGKAETVRRIQKLKARGGIAVADASVGVDNAFCIKGNAAVGIVASKSKRQRTVITDFVQEGGIGKCVGLDLRNSLAERYAVQRLAIEECLFANGYQTIGKDHLRECHFAELLKSELGNAVGNQEPSRERFRHVDDLAHGLVVHDPLNDTQIWIFLGDRDVGDLFTREIKGRNAFSEVYRFQIAAVVKRPRVYARDVVG